MMKAFAFQILLPVVFSACSSSTVLAGDTCNTNEDCDDGNICTEDVCMDFPLNCVNIKITGDMDSDGIYCNGVDRCEAGVFVAGTPIDCSDGNICTDDYCDEDLDTCGHDNNNNACNDLCACSENDVCSDGVCAGTPIPFCDKCIFDFECDDFIDCTINRCDDVDGVCTYTPDDKLCADDGVFCNGPEVCIGINGDPVTGCASVGPPCGDCEEDTHCGCQPPTVETYASRYIQVELPAWDEPYAIVVWTCGGTNPQYVGEWPGFGGPMPIDLVRSINPQVIDGSVAQLVDDPADALYLTPDEWYGTVWVTGLYVIPDGTFDVALDCGSPEEPILSSSVTVSTFSFGDTDGNGHSGLADSLFTVQAFQRLFVEGNTRIRSDLAGCLPDMNHSLTDTMMTILAFQNQDFENICPECFACP